MKSTTRTKSQRPKRTVERVRQSIGTKSFSGRLGTVNESFNPAQLSVRQAIDARKLQERIARGLAQRVDDYDVPGIVPDGGGQHSDREEQQFGDLVAGKEPLNISNAGGEFGDVVDSLTEGFDANIKIRYVILSSEKNAVLIVPVGVKISAPEETALSAVQTGSVT